MVPDDEDDGLQSNLLVASVQAKNRIDKFLFRTFDRCEMASAEGTPENADPS
jgi:hypothetical protein